MLTLVQSILGDHFCSPILLITISFFFRIKCLTLFQTADQLLNVHSFFSAVSFVNSLNSIQRSAGLISFALDFWRLPKSLLLSCNSSTSTLIRFFCFFSIQFDVHNAFLIFICLFTTQLFFVSFQHEMTTLFHWITHTHTYLWY